MLGSKTPQNGGLFVEIFYVFLLLNVTLPPIIMVASKMGASPIGSVPFKYSHVPLP